MNPLELGLIEQPTRPRSEYTLTVRREAIEAADQGNLRLAADLTRAAMTENGYARGILSDLTHGLWGLPRTFIGNAEMIADLNDTSERVGQFRIMFPSPDTIRLMSWGITLGVGLGQMRRRYDAPGNDYVLAPEEADGVAAGGPAPRKRPVGAHDTRVLRTWDPKYLRCQWWDETWWLMTADGEIRITPNDGEWLLYLPYGENKPWEYGAWKALTLAFILQRDALFDRARHSEKLAPVRVGTVPQGTTERQRQKFLTLIRQMQRMAMFVLPPGLDYKIVESTGRIADIYKQIIDWANEDFAMMTGAIITATGSAGFSKGDVQERFTRAILSSLGGSLSSCLHSGGLVPWGEDNYGSPDAPRAEFDCDPPEDRKARAETIGVAGDALAKLYAGAALAGLRPSQASVLKYIQGLGFEADVVPEDQARAAKVELAPTDKAKVFRAREVRAGDGYEPFGDERDEMTIPELDARAQAQAQPSEVAPPGGSGAAPAEDPGEPPTDESATTLAAAMTRHALERCEHGACNRCRKCGVERERGFVMGPGGSPVWKRAWRTIARSITGQFGATTGLPTRTYSGIKVFVDRPRGYRQSGTGADGASWERVYLVDYGFIDGTRGGDREELDVFCGPDRHAPQAFVAAQVNTKDRFDEYKVFLGFDTEDAARACYVAHIPTRMLSGFFSVPVEALRGFLGLEPRPKNALAFAGGDP